MQFFSIVWQTRRAELFLAFCTIAIFLGGIISPPTLMDDVDSVTAQIARNMIDSGDWVTPRLNGIAYFEKPALRFWIVAVSYLIFGVHDWAARMPIALAAIGLCWLARSMGIWAFSKRAGNLAGLILATCVGLFLFTRILIPDVVLTLSVTLALYGLIRALDPEEPHPVRWSLLLAIGIATGFLLKGLVAIAFVVGVGGLYLLITRNLFSWTAWGRINPIRNTLLILAIAMPWVALAVLRNPPYFDFTMKAEPGQYRGFFWFFFLNEHLFRYLNLRYPRDYNTVPRVLFWLYHLLWLFPWSLYLPAIFREGWRLQSRADRMRALCACWIGFILLFFTFSTTQEYYTMPCYPAFALLLGRAMELEEKHPMLKWGARITGTLALAGAIACAALLWMVRGIATKGDISDALNYQVSTLSLGRTQELTIEAFAYLRLPLAVAGIALLLGGLGAVLLRGRRVFAAHALMMVLFFHAARLALITFSPYLGSRPLAEALKNAPPGRVIVDDQYYSFSSVFFYAGLRPEQQTLLLNGRVMNLEYGSYAPGAPSVFIGDSQLPALWQSGQRHYLTAHISALPRLKALLGVPSMHIVAAAGGKFLLTNQALPSTRPLSDLDNNSLSRVFR